MLWLCNTVQYVKNISGLFPAFEVVADNVYATVQGADVTKGGQGHTHTCSFSVWNTHTGHSGLTKYNGMLRARGAVIVIVLTLGLVGNAGAQRRWRSIVDDRHDR